jgi:uncharacterized membrane protein YedE/YeeE
MKPGPLAFGCGLLFALGLGLAGMTRPSKVLGFLDVGGRWDPSLALVMMGAIAVHLPLRRLRRPAPGGDIGCAADDGDADGTASAIDRRLVIGAALFGVGWGLSGYCPGPALVSLAGGSIGVLTFVGAMLIGMALHRSIMGVSRS